MFADAGGGRRSSQPRLRADDVQLPDRGEIEALRSLRQLVRRYLDDRKADKPLSIGVFGPPGAGKSFAVRELAKQLLGGRLGWLEFNLSQFNGPADLIGALHQVRDKILADGLNDSTFDVTRKGKHLNAAAFRDVGIQGILRHDRMKPVSFLNQLSKPLMSCGSQLLGRAGGEVGERGFAADFLGGINLLHTVQQTRFRFRRVGGG